ncbi:hypothetical protein [Lignipirellula cremea]|uniref:hypothetical protein n=1 Tax=Lignipirellula cremea TaxID=2528010 RepID=UPI00119D19E3|nr:hypothetical protein [Lignipirellula cremea]
MRNRHSLIVILTLAAFLWVVPLGHHYGPNPALLKTPSVAAPPWHLKVERWCKNPPTISLTAPDDRAAGRLSDSKPRVAPAWYSLASIAALSLIVVCDRSGSFSIQSIYCSAVALIGAQFFLFSACFDVLHANSHDDCGST